MGDPAESSDMNGCPVGILEWVRCLRGIAAAVLTGACVVACGADDAAQSGSEPGTGTPVARAAPPSMAERSSVGTGITCDDGNWAACVHDGNALQRSGEPAQAVAHYQRACGGGYAPGCGELAHAYQVGHGIARDLDLARDLYRSGCEGGHARSCSRLGALYLEGIGVARDLALAVAYSDEGCRAQDGLGCVNLGLMHQRAEGVPKDTQLAARLFRKGCEADEAAACRYLGEAYAGGLGVVADAKLAASLNIRACLKGDGPACGNAGVNYQVGLGVRANPARAAEYFGRACDAGEQRYCELLERFERGGTELKLSE